MQVKTWLPIDHSSRSSPMATIHSIPTQKQPVDSSWSDSLVPIKLLRSRPQLLPALETSETCQHWKEIQQNRLAHTFGGGRLLAICGDGTWGSRAWNAEYSGLLFNPPPVCGGSRSRGSFVFCWCKSVRRTRLSLQVEETYSGVGEDAEGRLGRVVRVGSGRLAGGLLLDLVDERRHDYEFVRG